MYVLFFFLMIRQPPISKRTDTLFPYTTLFLSQSELLVQKRMGQSSQTDESHCHLDPARRLKASERLLGTAIHESIDGTSAHRGSGGLQGVESFPEAPRSEERSVGKECVSTCSCWVRRYHEKKKKIKRDRK